MGILGFLDKEKISHSQDEIKEIIKPDNDKKNRRLSDSEKLDLILAQLKALTIAISEHDRHLTIVNTGLINRITESLRRKKEIPQSKRMEAEKMINSAYTRVEAVEKLKSIGISQATAYRYTEDFVEKTQPAQEKPAQA
jgi:hypothetical protein